MSGTAIKTKELAGKIVFLETQINEIKDLLSGIAVEIESTLKKAELGLQRIEGLEKAKHAAHAAKEVAKTAGETARAKESAEALLAAERTIKSQAKDVENLISQAVDFGRRIEELRGRLIPIPNQTHAVLQTVKNLDTAARRLQDDIISANRKIERLRNLNTPGG